MFGKRIREGDKEGLVEYNPSADSYVVWFGKANGPLKTLFPAYGNGVDAENRLLEELFKKD